MQTLVSLEFFKMALKKFWILREEILLRSSSSCFLSKKLFFQLLSSENYGES